MAIKFEKIEPGMTLYDVKKNTKGFPRNCKWHVWPVNIIKVDVENRKYLLLVIVIHQNGYQKEMLQNTEKNIQNKRYKQ